MTEKRFTLVDDEFVSRIKNNGVSMTAREIVDCLNALHEENIGLKEYIQHIHRLYEDTHGINMENEEWWEDD